MLGCQSGVTAKVGRHLHPRYKQMKGTRSFEGIIAEQMSDGLKNQLRLSILGWNADFWRGKVTNIVVGSYHVILLQKAGSHFQKVGRPAHAVHKNTFEPDGAKIEGVITWHFKARLIGLEILSTHMSNTTAKRRDVAKQLFGPAQESRREK